MKSSKSKNQIVKFKSLKFVRKGDKVRVSLYK
jgi:hypothetical protein